jgi:hypothetical protein
MFLDVHAGGEVKVKVEVKVILWHAYAGTKGKRGYSSNPLPRRPGRFTPGKARCPLFMWVVECSKHYVWIVKDPVQEILCPYLRFSQRCFRPFRSSGICLWKVNVCRAFIFKTSWPLKMKAPCSSKRRVPPNNTASYPTIPEFRRVGRLKLRK